MFGDMDNIVVPERILKSEAFKTWEKKWGGTLGPVSLPILFIHSFIAHSLQNTGYLRKREDGTPVWYKDVGKAREFFFGECSIYMCLHVAYVAYVVIEYVAATKKYR